MIVKIRGQLTEVEETTAVIDRDGIAYEVFVPAYAVTELTASRGQTVTLFTLEYLEGGAAGSNLTPRMIGFLHPEDRAFFRDFLTVKGMGMRKALKAMAAPIAQIASHIEKGEVAALTRLPGVGKRMAELIVAELRGKVADHAFAAKDVPTATRHELSEEQRAAIEIIIAWGDNRADAERWVARAAQLHEKLATAEEWVRAAYRIRSGAQS